MQFRSQFFLLASLLTSLGVPSTSASQDSLQSFRANVAPILETYCFDCHGYGSSEGGVVLDEFTSDSIDDHELWLRVLKNTRSHIMPPLEAAQPTVDERAQLADWIKRDRFAIESDNPDPGASIVRRLNRTEYQNTIFDLIGIRFNALNEFPADNSGEGFDNIGELLTLSPMMLEKYLDAASRIVSEAVPTQSLVISEHVLSGKDLVRRFNPAANADDRSTDHLQMSFYTPSTRSADYEIESPGKYQLVLNLKPVSFSSFNGFDYNRCRFVVKIDGESVVDQEFEYTSGKNLEYTFDYDWQAGDHQIAFEIEPLTSGLDEVKRLKMRIEQVAIRGPQGREHWVHPQNYDRFFPGVVPEEEPARRDYTRQLLADFATRAYRRPVDQETVDRLVELACSVSDQTGFTYEMGVSQAMVAILASPRFIFREEAGLDQKSGRPFTLVDEWSLASRLSYFLWSTMPDEELFQLAKAGKLRANLDTQIERMMQGKRFDQFIKNFAGQWLHARDIESVNISSHDVLLRDKPNPVLLAAREQYNALREIPDEQRTPQQTIIYKLNREIVRAASKLKQPELKQRELHAMRQETELYFDYVIRDDRSLVELIDSNYTFLNDILAKHYDIAGVAGAEMRKVELEPNSPRGGVLTQGTILAVTSNPTRTSPVKRGVFILENILGTPPAAPPPNIPALEDVAGSEKLKTMSLRETLALHRENELCASCHNRMDPLGLALENFNAMGMWRESEQNIPIDVAGTLVTGEEFSSIQEMKRILATDRIQDFYYCFSEKLLTYALGRGLDYYDTTTIDHLVDTLMKTAGRPSAVIQEIIDSAPFQKCRNNEFRPDES